MVKTNSSTQSLKEIRERDEKAKQKEIIAKCEAKAIERLGDAEKLKQFSNKHGGIWYLPIIDEAGNIEKLAIFKPIDRNILSYASTKMQDEGLYAFLESAMNECILKDYSDMEIIEDDEYFLPASTQFNKLIEGKKAYMLKR